jgi:hypothetical protein
MEQLHEVHTWLGRSIGFRRVQSAGRRFRATSSSASQACMTGRFLGVLSLTQEKHLG